MMPYSAARSAYILFICVENSNISVKVFQSQILDWENFNFFIEVFFFFQKIFNF